mmetsp:Transcript_1084/g.2047  ORF Transcript_1084/g.2047 Transcript_1084/m.2047 type:complete len:114 (+) Transcript_1084:422-763(+)
MNHTGRSDWRKYELRTRFNGLLCLLLIENSSSTNNCVWELTMKLLNNGVRVGCGECDFYDLKWRLDVERVEYEPCAFNGELRVVDANAQNQFVVVNGSENALFGMNWTWWWER